MLNLLFMLIFLLLSYGAQIEPTPARIAYVIDSKCFLDDRHPTCPVEIGIFDPVSETETRYPLPGQFIEPTTLQALSDGNEIAFQYLPEDEYLAEIAILDTTTGQTRLLNVLSPGEAYAGFLFSPDEQTLAYIIQTPEQPKAHNLTLYNLQTGESEVILRDYWTLFIEGWSPDQQSLAITAAPIEADPTEPDFDVHILNILTGELTNLTPDEHDSGGASWSSDGELLAMVVVDQDAATTAIATISPEGDDFSVWARGNYLTNPQWALDDTALVYGDYGTELSDHIWMVHLAREEAEIIVDKPHLGSYTVSPDGEWLTYITRSDDFRNTILCIYDLRLRTDTCYPEIIVDENAFPIWLD